MQENFGLIVRTLKEGEMCGTDTLTDRASYMLGEVP